MAIVKRLLGVYLIGVAMVVAVWFIINSFFVDSFDLLNVWRVLDVLMVIGLAVALVFNYDRKRTEDRNPGESITRRYLEFNTAFYLTAGLLILLLHNWLSLLALGSERSLGVGSEQGFKSPDLGHLGGGEHADPSGAGRHRLRDVEEFFRQVKGLESPGYVLIPANGWQKMDSVPLQLVESGDIAAVQEYGRKAVRPRKPQTVPGAERCPKHVAH